MKILHLLDWYRPFGGAERLLFSQLELLERAGHENIVVANDVPGQERTNRRPEHFVENLEVSFNGVPPSSLVGRGAWISKLRGELARIVALHAPDVAHIHNLQNPFALKAVTSALPSVRSIHDPRLYCFTNWKLLPNQDICPHPLGRACLSEGCIPRNPLALTSVVRELPYRYLHLRANKTVGLLIAESRAVRQDLLQNGFAPERLALLPNFTPGYGSWDEVSAFNAAHREPGSRAVLFVGRASYEKGIEVLLEAMALLPSPWKLILVTGGEYMAKVRAKIAALGLAGRVELPGILSYEDTRLCYARADVVAFPSVWTESFGLVGLEAMANGKPVVAFDTGGVPDWLADGETGFLVPLKDRAAFAARVGELLDDPALAARLGRAGFDRVARNFSGELYLRRLLDIYQAAIQLKGARAGAGAAA